MIICLPTHSLSADASPRVGVVAYLFPSVHSSIHRRNCHA